MEHNASTNLKSIDGRTALDVAMQKKNGKILQILCGKFLPMQELSNSTEKECDVCYGNRNGTFAFLPCGHANACETCCSRIVEGTKKCPICRTHVQQYKKIFS